MGEYTYCHNTGRSQRNPFVHGSQSSVNSQYVTRHNTIVEQVLLNERKQTPKESVDTFIYDLCLIAEDFEYSTLNDLLIRDRIVIGVLNDTMTLNQIADLTLADAIRMSRQA